MSISSFHGIHPSQRFPQNNARESIFHSIQGSPYFKKEADNAGKADTLLQNASHGTFLVRPTTKGDFAVSIKDGYKSNFAHYPFVVDSNGELIQGNKRYKDLAQLLDFIKETHTPSPVINEKVSGVGSQNIPQIRVTSSLATPSAIERTHTPSQVINEKVSGVGSQNIPQIRVTSSLAAPNSIRDSSRPRKTELESYNIPGPSEVLPERRIRLGGLPTLQQKMIDTIQSSRYYSRRPLNAEDMAPSTIFVHRAANDYNYPFRILVRKENRECVTYSFAVEERGYILVKGQKEEDENIKIPNFDQFIQDLNEIHGKSSPFDGDYREIVEFMMKNHYLTAEITDSKKAEEFIKKNSKIGEYFFRFSSSSPNKIAITYIDCKGEIKHNLIDISADKKIKFFAEQGDYQRIPQFVASHGLTTCCCPPNTRHFNFIKG